MNPIIMAKHVAVVMAQALMDHDRVVGDVEIFDVKRDVGGVDERFECKEKLPIEGESAVGIGLFQIRTQSHVIENWLCLMGKTDVAHLLGSCLLFGNGERGGGGRS